MAQESRLVISIDARNAQTTAQNLNKELQNITNSGNAADRQVNVLGGSLRNLASYMAGIVTVGAAINKMDAYANLQNRLRLVTNGQQELNKATSDTFAIAQKTYQEWSSVVQVYQRFSDNAKVLNINMAQTARLTETVSKAVAISGSTAESAQAALVQFGQALASGTLRGEELNSVMEQTPALAKAIANGMGITIGQLRTVAAEGKITSAVLVDALGKAAANVDEQFSKMQMTISQSLTLLNNEITKFAENTGGASSAISSSIKLIAENLEFISGAAIVAGIGYLTTAIVAKTTAIGADVLAMTAQRAATQAQLIEEVKLSVAVTNEAKAHLALITATNASTQAKFGATAANARYKLASDAVTEAVTRQAAAERAAQAVTTTGERVGASLLGILGGPVGIGITVASLAAGYLLMRDSTAKANEKLEEQGKIAEKTNEELTKLAGNDKKNAVTDLTAAFKAQNDELAKSKEAVDAVLFAIRASSVENEKARKVTEDAKRGLISYNQAIELLNKMDISPELYEMLKKTAGQYDENSLKAGKTQKALSILGFEFTLSGNKAQNAVNQLNANTNALDENARAANAAAKAHQDYLSKAQSQAFNDIYSTGLMSQGYTPAQSKAILDLQNAKGTSAILTKEEIAQALQNLKLTEQNTAAEKRYADGISKRAKAQSDAARKAEQARREAEREAEQLAKEQADLREGITYENADRIEKIELDLAQKLKDIQKANFANPKDSANYTQYAKDRAEVEKKLIKDQMEYEANEWNWSEEKKLEKRVQINLGLLNLDMDMNEKAKDDAFKNLISRSNFEADQIDLAKEQRIFAAQESMMTEMEAVRARYDLERKEIARTRGEKERAAIQEAKDKAYINLGVATGGSMLGSVQSRSTTPYKQEDVLTDEYNKQRAEMDLRYKQQQEAEKANAEALTKIHQDYLMAKGRLNSEYDEKVVIARENDSTNQLQNYSNMIAIAQGTFGQMTDMIKQAQGENSSAYKAMFLIQQGMAAAQALIYANLASTAALAPPPIGLGPIAGAPLAGMIKLNGYASAALIAAQTVAGFKTGGYTGNLGTSDVAGVVHGQEYVLNAAATKRVGTGTLDAINSGGSLGGEISVNIQNYGTSKQFDVQQIDANTVRIIARDEARTAITSDLQNPNSAVSKGIKNNFNTSNRRG